MKRVSPDLQRPSAQVSSTIGPEMVGGLLAALVLVAVAVVALAAGGGSPTAGATDGAAGSSPPIDPSGGLFSPSGDIPTTEPPAATRAPWAATAARLLEADDQLVTLRDDLAALIDPRPKRADQIARALRNINELLLFANATIVRLDDAGLPPDQGEALRTAHSAALDHSLATLQLSVQNVKAYVSGAKDVLAALEPLETLAAGLARASGLPPPSR
jgi:hypothetical protein